MSSVSLRIPAAWKGELAVQVAGHGGPVLLTNHAIMASSWMWRGQVECLVQRGWRVVSVDTRGHGASSEPAPICSFEDLVADNIAVLDALEIERAHFLGSSLGGMTGFGLGILNPDRIETLVICDARADAPPEFARPWDERILVAQRDGVAALADSTLERWFGGAFLTRNQTTTLALKQMIAGASVGGFVACARALQGLAYIDRLGEIRAPVRMIVGEQDGVLPQAMADLQLRLRDATLQVIPAAGHLPNIDQPQAFDVALLRALNVY